MGAGNATKMQKTVSKTVTTTGKYGLSSLPTTTRDDPARLTKDILEAGNEVYVGLRSKREFEAAKQYFHTIVWVDASERVPCEDPASCDLRKEDVLEEPHVVVLDNNGTLEELVEKMAHISFQGTKQNIQTTIQKDKK